MRPASSDTRSSSALRSLPTASPIRVASSSDLVHGCRKTSRAGQVGQRLSISGVHAARARARDTGRGPWRGAHHGTQAPKHREHVLSGVPLLGIQQPRLEGVDVVVAQVECRRDALEQRVRYGGVSVGDHTSHVRERSLLHVRSRCSAGRCSRGRGGPRNGEAADIELPRLATVWLPHAKLRRNQVCSEKSAGGKQRREG